MNRSVLAKRFSFFEVKCFIFIIITLFSLLVPTVTHAFFGVSPSRVIIGDILSGTIVAEKVMITRAEPENDITVQVSFSGPQKDAIIGASEFTLPAGMQQVPYYFIVASSGLPKNEDLSATITFLLSSEVVEGGSSISLTLSSDIHFRVTDVRTERFQIKQVNFESNKDGKIGMYYFLLNHGNVETSPTLIKVILTDQDSLKISEVIVIEESEIPQVAAFSEQNIVFDLEHHLSSGKYFVEAEIFKDNAIIFHSPKAALQVIGGASTVTKIIR